MCTWRSIISLSITLSPTLFWGGMYTVECISKDPPLWFLLGKLGMGQSQHIGSGQGQHTPTTLEPRTKESKLSQGLTGKLKGSMESESHSCTSTFPLYVVGVWGLRPGRGGFKRPQEASAQQGCTGVWYYQAMLGCGTGEQVLELNNVC